MCWVLLGSFSGWKVSLNLGFLWSCFGVRYKFPEFVWSENFCWGEKKTKQWLNQFGDGSNDIFPFCSAIALQEKPGASGHLLSRLLGSSSVYIRAGISLTELMEVFRHPEDQCAALTSWRFLEGILNRSYLLPNESWGCRYEVVCMLESHLKNFQWIPKCKSGVKAWSFY